MALIMPVLNTAAQRYRVDLDGVRYLVRLVWHPRVEAWVFDLGLPGATNDDSLWIARGVTLRRSFFVLVNHRDLRKPRGAFVVLGGRQVDPISFDSLVEGRDRLYYYSRAELVYNAETQTGLGPDPDTFGVTFS